jgi:glyoxylase-like metal-dependent hydrolase (beta-lactamase superfamily II)
MTQSSEDSYNVDTLVKNVPPPTFHPPSFGVTVLGNSHGFDASGSVSGYVLWINGRGVMIDPPPYSSATLEREGIRPRTIVGIILTHCHADHDAGAFQKVLTGSPVVVITTPTIYKIGPRCSRRTARSINGCNCERSFVGSGNNVH